MLRTEKDRARHTITREDKMADPDPPQMDVYSGVRWSAVAKYGTQAIEMVVSIIVARIVAPEAYGLLGMAVVITGFLTTFQTLGFGSALIQRKEINERLLSSLFYVTLVMGLIMAAGLAAGSPLASWAYSDTRVGPIVAVLSLTFLFSAPAIVPSALLQRRLAFRSLAAVDITVSLTRGVTVLSLALLGWGVWAMVWSSLAGVAVRTPLIFAVSGWRPQRLFCWSQVRSVLGFGANLTGFSIFNYFGRNADNFIIGSFLGATPLGYYSLAYRILLLPRDAITNVLRCVLFPAFSRLEDDRELGSAYLRSCGAIAFVTFPIMTGIAITARPAVEVLLGERWLPAVPLLWFMAPLGMSQSIMSSVGQLYLVKGRTDIMLRWGVFRGSLVILSFVVGVRWGVLGVALAYLMANVVLDVPTYLIAFRLVKGLRLRGLLRAIMPYFTMSAVMGSCVLGLSFTMRQYGFSSWQVLATCVPLGAGTYVLATLMLRPPAFYDFTRLLGVDKLSKRFMVHGSSPEATTPAR